MHPSFPFTPTFDVGMGITPLKEQDFLLEVDAHYGKEIALKRNLLHQDLPYYLQCKEGAELAQWETVTLLLRDLASHYPEHFSYREDGKRCTWTNHLLQEQQS